MTGMWTSEEYRLTQRVRELEAQRDEARATKDMFKKRYKNADKDLTEAREEIRRFREREAMREVVQLLHRSDIERARIAGQGQALKALLQEIEWVRTSETDPALDHLEGWARDTLKELGEEPREVRT